MGIGRILLSSQHFFHTPNSLQLPLNHPPCCPSTHTHLHTSPQGCFVHHWNVCVELCVQPPPNLHHAHHAKSQSPCICTLALPPLVWLVHSLCAHHLPSTSSNIPHCTHTSAHTPSPAALPHLDVPVHPCFPLPGGLLPQNSPSGKGKHGWTGTSKCGDRKSTRLNSSHANISYAVFCLK